MRVLRFASIFCHPDVNGHVVRLCVDMIKVSLNGIEILNLRENGFFMRQNATGMSPRLMQTILCQSDEGSDDSDLSLVNK